MKFVRKALVMMLVLIVAASVMLLSVSAVDLSYYVKMQFNHFDTVYYNNQYSGYTYALQKFLNSYSTVYANILKNAEKNGNQGIDGWFGQYTYSALTSYQRQKGLDPDGWAGTLTWQAVANDLNEDTYSAYKVLSVHNKSVIGVYMKDELPNYFVYYDGNGSIGSRFHTCVIEV